MVGRREERALLAALAAQRKSAVIGGSSGIGKTRLARAVRSDAATAGLTTAWLTATESSRSIPFGALSPLLAGDPLEGVAAPSPASMFRALGSRRGGRRHLPDLVVVDDAHLLDAASATLVLQLVTAASSCALLTMNSSSEPPAAVTALWKDGGAHRIELQPLSRSENDALVVEILGGSCNALTLERIWKTTEGNALYVCELLEAARIAGGLSQERGHWRLDTSREVGAPLAGLVAERIDRLDPTARRVLEVVALSAPVSSRLLEAVVDLDAVAVAEELGMVEVVLEGQRTVARPTHPMHAEVARRAMPGARRLALCRALADALEAIGLRRRNDLLRFLNWRLDAAERPPVELLLRGAWQAGEALDMRLAERFARSAVAIAPSHHSARLALADAVYRQARHAEALEVLDGSDAADDRERTEVVVARAKAMWGVGLLDESERVVLEAASTIRDRDCLGWLQGFRSTLRTALGYPMEGIALAQVVVEDPSYGARTTLSGLGSLALAFAFSGRSASAVDGARRGTDPGLLAAAESRTQLSWVAPALWAAAWLSGDVEEAHRLADAYRRSGLETNDPERVAGGSMAVGWAALMRGDIDAALPLFEEAVALVPIDDRIGVKTIALIGASWAHAWNADAVAAAAALDEADAASVNGARWFDACATIGRAWVAATLGDDREARGLFEQAANDAERRGLLPYAALALHCLARLGRPRAVASRLAALGRRVDGPVTPAIVAHAEALASEDPAALAACCDRFEDLGMRLLAAECAAAEARACEARGDPAAAEAARTRGNALQGTCGVARPATLERLRTRSPLTARERQVAELAAQGRTTREIADHLALSVRTVDSHLAHIYSKLAIDSRHKLAAALTPATLATYT